MQRAGPDPSHDRQARSQAGIERKKISNISFLFCINCLQMTGYSIQCMYVLVDKLNGKMYKWINAHTFSAQLKIGMG